jgi:hypothetical protein
MRRLRRSNNTESEESTQKGVEITSPTEEAVMELNESSKTHPSLPSQDELIYSYF